MSRFFKPYEGSRPYLFVSYSHRQSDEVVDTIRLLHERRCRVWYDEGIPAGGDWPKNVENHMRRSAAVLFFLSKSALASQNCFSEIKTALREHKRVLVLPLEKAEADEDWRALLKKAEWLVPASDARGRAENILAEGRIGRSFFRGPFEGLRWDRVGLAASVLLFALTLGAVYGLFTGRITPPGAAQGAAVQTAAPESETPSPTPTEEIDMSPWESLFPVEFPDAQQEKAVRSALEKPEGDILLNELPEIRTLYFCGNMILQDLSAVAFESDGTPAVNGARVIEGKVADLAVIGRMPNLEELALIRQPIGSLSALSALTRLRELSLAGSGATALGALGAQPSLETLHLEHSAARDLTALGNMAALRRVTVSADMLPLRWDDGAAFDVILVP